VIRSEEIHAEERAGRRVGELYCRELRSVCSVEIYCVRAITDTDVQTTWELHLPINSRCASKFSHLLSDSLLSFW